MQWVGTMIAQTTEASATRCQLACQVNQSATSFPPINAHYNFSIPHQANSGCNYFVFVQANGACLLNSSHTSDAAIPGYFSGPKFCS